MSLFVYSVKDIRAVIGTNAWGSSLYGKAIRGSAVSEDIIKEAVERSIELDMAVFDTAQDYGLGKCQPLIFIGCTFPIPLMKI